MKILHRDLRPFPLAEAMAALLGGVPGTLVVTMSEGQWDGVLSAAYSTGWILLELDENETPVKAYRKGAE
jgi:hypothetical protein